MLDVRFVPKGDELLRSELHLYLVTSSARVSVAPDEAKGTSVILVLNQYKCIG
jgi:hypothetical protein